jgi:hypothetical protein
VAIMTGSASTALRSFCVSLNFGACVLLTEPLIDAQHAPESSGWSVAYRGWEQNYAKSGNSFMQTNATG